MGFLDSTHLASTDPGVKDSMVGVPIYFPFSNILPIVNLFFSNMSYIKLYTWKTCVRHKNEKFSKYSAEFQPQIQSQVSFKKCVAQGNPPEPRRGRGDDVREGRRRRGSLQPDTHAPSWYERLAYPSQKSFFFSYPGSQPGSQPSKDRNAGMLPDWHAARLASCQTGRQTGRQGGTHRGMQT